MPPILCGPCKWEMEEALFVNPDADVPDVAPAVAAISVHGERLALCERHLRAARRLRTRYGIEPNAELRVPEVH